MTPNVQAKNDHRGLGTEKYGKCFENTWQVITLTVRILVAKGFKAKPRTKFSFHDSGMLLDRSRLGHVPRDMIKLIPSASVALSEPAATLLAFRQPREVYRSSVAANCILQEPVETLSLKIRSIARYTQQSKIKAIANFPSTKTCRRWRAAGDGDEFARLGLLR